MNKIDAIVVHCSATKVGQDIGKKEINQMHVLVVSNVSGITTSSG